MGEWGGTLKGANPIMWHSDEKSQELETRDPSEREKSGSENRIVWMIVKGTYRSSDALSNP